MSVLFLSLRYIMFLGYIPTLLFEVNSPNSNNVRLRFDINAP